MFAIAGCGKDGPGPGSTGTLTANAPLGRVVTIGNNLYAVSHGQLKTYDIANAANPTEINRSNFGSNPSVFSNYQNYIYVGYTNSFSDAFQIFNTASTNPSLQSSHPIFKPCSSVAINANYAFITERTNSECGAGGNNLTVLDISTSQATVVRTYNLTSPYGLALDGNNLFVCDAGIKYYDASNPANLVLKQTININATTVTAQNGKLAATGTNSLYQYDYSSGTLVQLSSLKIK